MEVTFILNIRERNDCAKDKQSKYRVASTGQHQMVQKFVKELNDSTKQSEQPSNAERTATEQVETTAREIVHEAVQLPRRAIQHTARRESADSSANSQPEQSDQPRHAPESPRERPAAPRTQPDATPPQSTPTPAPQEQARRAYVQQTAKSVTPAPPITSEQPRPQHTTVTVAPAENAPRQRMVDIRTLSEPQRPQNVSPPVPRVYIQQTAKASTTTKAPERSTIPDTTPIEKQPRQRMEDVRIRPELTQQHKPEFQPQEQGRRAYVKRAKKSRTEKSSARDHLHTEQPEIRLADDMPQNASPPIREKPTFTELRSEPPPEPTPENASNVQHIKQTGTWTPRGTEPYSRGIEQPIRERSAVTSAHDLPPAPQAQAQQAFAKKQAQLSKNPSIESIYPPKPAAPTAPQPPVLDTPTTTPERQSVTTGSKPAPPVQPPASAQALPLEQPPAIREKPKPNAAPREKSRRGVDIRTRDTEQISPPKKQSKTSVSKTASKRARKAATQDAQRKMLKKSNNRASRAAAAAAKKLAEAAAKAVKELISTLASLGGGTALFVVFSIVIVAGAFLASPLGILFADEQESDDTVPLATAIAEIQGEYHAELERLQNGDFVSVQIIGQAPDWREQLLSAV